MFMALLESANAVCRINYSPWRGLAITSQQTHALTTQVTKPLSTSGVPLWHVPPADSTATEMTSSGNYTVHAVEGGLYHTCVMRSSSLCTF